MAWNGYIAFNDDGLITGRVIAGDGRTVGGAKVVLSERTLLVATPQAETGTDGEGRFAFKGHHLHRLYLEAQKPGAGRFGPKEFRLYFKGENLILDQPLELEKAS